MHRDPRQFFPVFRAIANPGLPLNRGLNLAPNSLTQLANSDYPFDDLPQGKDFFDTSPLTASDASTALFRARITGLQIKIRVYEPKNNMTRQSTIVVKL